MKRSEVRKKVDEGKKFREEVLMFFGAEIGRGGISGEEREKELGARKEVRKFDKGRA